MLDSVLKLVNTGLHNYDIVTLRAHLFCLPIKLLGTQIEFQKLSLLIANESVNFINTEKFGLCWQWLIRKQMKSPENASPDLFPGGFH